MRIRTLTSVAALTCAMLASPAHADWLFTPYVGGNVGGDTVKTQPNVGISAAWMGAGTVGFEFDAAWAPDFFDTGDDNAAALLSSSRVSTYMFNAIIGVPAGGQTGRGVRPYASAGVGAIQTRAESDLGLVDIDQTDFGWNAGAGVLGFFNDVVGVRADARFLQTLQQATDGANDNPLTADNGHFGFWRLTAGITFRWK